MGLIAIGPGRVEDAARYIPHWRGTVVALSRRRPPRRPPPAAVAARYPDPAELGRRAMSTSATRSSSCAWRRWRARRRPARAMSWSSPNVTEALHEVTTPRARTSPSASPAWSSPNRCSLRCYGGCVAPRRAAGNLPLLAQAAFAELRSAIRFRRTGVLARRGGCLERDCDHAVLAVESLHGELQARVEELGIERDFVTSVLETGAGHVLTQNARAPSGPRTAMPGCCRGIREKSWRASPSPSVVGDDTVHEPLGHFVELVSGQRQAPRGGARFALQGRGKLDVVWHHSILKGQAQGEPSILSVGMDITARKSAELRLTWLADHDPLTDLFNRRRLQEELEEAIARAKRYRHSGALVIVDLDQFKYVERYQRPPGGRSPAGEPRRVTAARAPRGRRIARLGGDEFAIVLGKADEAEAVQVAKKSWPTSRRSRSAPIVAFIGLGEHRHHPLSATRRITVQDLLAHADLALYDVKESGGGVATCSPGDQGYRAMQERVLWKERVERALVDERFVLRAGDRRHPYQAHQPLRGLVAHAARRRQSHQPGPVHRGGRARRPHRPHRPLVVAEAVRAQARLAAIGEDVSFAVNLSAHAFNDPELLTFLADLLRDTGLDPKRRILEMTETATVADFGAARSLMEAIRGLGCSFALDDFGRGFSSFFYLKELPMEYVKMDGSFVRDLLERPDDQALVRAMAQIRSGLRQEDRGRARGVRRGLGAPGAVRDRLCPRLLHRPPGTHDGRFPRPHRRMHPLPQTTGDLKRTARAVMPPVAFWSLRLVETEEQVLDGSARGCCSRRPIAAPRVSCLGDGWPGDGLRRDARHYAGRPLRGGRAGV